MLLSLSIRNFVIVDRLDLDFAGGFTVLSGETGAGKSILIDALLLALGERADPSVLREGAARAEVSAEFATTAAVQTWLQAHELGSGDGSTASVLIRRTVDADGRSKGYVNGTPVPLAQLRELGALLVDVHGQHAHQSLLKPSAQQRMLDELGGLEASTAEVAGHFEAWRRLSRRVKAAEERASQAAVERDHLQWRVDELSDLAPEAGEWEAVQVEHRRMAHAASLIEGAQFAIEGLSEADDAALGRLDAVLVRLRPLMVFDERLPAMVTALESVRIQVDEVARELHQYLTRIALDDSRLAALDERLGDLHAASRKFRCAAGELPALLARSRDELAELAAATDLGALKQQEAEAAKAFHAQAHQLSIKRRAAAERMSAEVTRAMQDLSMAGGRFQVQLVPCEPAAIGLERVEFLVAGHAGTAPRPLAKVASGGELARISLAISVIAATATPVATLIFDEVDAGIGGAVAETVGRLLKSLGQMRQVLCVTHLPQVAARGDQHLQVSKHNVDQGKPVSRIVELNRQARVEELARMLGGLSITETTRKHAREMLAA